jgi:5-methylcytosine-specific restriction enzyme subunit McrC
MNLTMSDLIKVKEYSKSDKLDWKDDEKKYFSSKFFNPNGKYPNIEISDGVLRNNGPWAGIIKYNDKEVNFCTKMNANFFYMLSYLNEIDSFKFDHKRLIRLEQGKLFFDVLAKIMINELEGIIKKGMLKKYVVKEENIKFLRGKLMVKNQIKHNSFNKSKFYCKYDDLTYNNLENKSVLYAAHLLHKFVKNRDLKIKLKKFENRLSDEISLEKINPELLLNIRYNRINKHYEKILNLSYHIIRRIFAQDVASKKGIGFNFIVDMNKVYESFLTQMLKEIIEEDYTPWKVASQSKNINLVIDGKMFTLKPDVLVLESGKAKVIIDIKYKLKKGIPNSDFYQMVCYSLAYPDTSKRILLYEEIEEKGADYSVIDANGEKIKIDFYQANLFNILNDDSVISIDSFKEVVKNYLRGKKIIKELEFIK